jgi:F-type H+-transporting ATPase subunit epsilon
MFMTLEVSIIVPERVFWKDNVEEIILPTLTGQIGILTNHTPLMTGLEIGVLFIRLSPDVEWLPFIVAGGFALINKNRVTILVNEAELGSDINIKEAESTFLDIQSQLKDAMDEKTKLKLTSKLEKAFARLQFARQKYS